MSSQKVICPEGVWTKVTNSSKSGVIILRSGNVRLTEQSSAPTSLTDTPISSSLTFSGDFGSYHDVASGESIYVLSISAESILDVTPVGGVI